MGQTASNLVQTSHLNTISKVNYDNLNKNFLIIEKTNKELKIIINEKENKCIALKSKLESSELLTKSKNIELLNLGKENKINKNKYILAENHYTELKKKFDILNINNTENEETIKSNDKIIKEKDAEIKKLKKQLSSIKQEDDKQDLEIQTLKQKNQELRKQAIASEQELTKLKQNFSMINNIVDKVID
tara:strand:- start:13 stop:579 length:567 start_codon:yes stop_codon:yes gene_type:complete